MTAATIIAGPWLPGFCFGKLKVKADKTAVVNNRVFPQGVRRDLKPLYLTTSLKTGYERFLRRPEVIVSNLSSTVVAVHTSHGDRFISA